MKTIGILGGMGPESSVAFFMEVIKECQKQYGAKYDEDYPKVIMYNVPIPDIVENIADKEKTIDIVSKNLKQLENNKADFIAVPCNTINIIYKEMCDAVKIPVLSIIKETVKKIKEKGIKKIGILSTKAVIEFNLYAKELEKNNIKYINPSQSEIEILTRAIISVMAGKKEKQDKEKLKIIIKKMENQGAEAVVLGCTDLPLLIRQMDYPDIEILDTIKILAEATVKYALDTKTI